MMDKITGKVAFLNTEKGFGFLEIAGYQKNVFFHAKDLRHISFEQIRKGDVMAVESIEQGERGYKARNVFLIS